MADRSGEFCRVERDGKLTFVTITRPEVMNSLHPAANQELAAAFDDFQNDPEQWVAIITGEGERAFSAGNDLKATAAGGGTISQPAAGFAGLTSRLDLDKPVIAAVNGVAMGGGFEIALACDIIIAAENALFALPEPRVGLAALAGGLQRLPRMIGLKPAMGMILTGRRVGAQEALALGIANEVVPQSDLLEAARRWAEQILECAPLSVRASKQVVLRSLDVPVLADALDNRQYPAVGNMMRSADFTEGPRAFAEKRPPQWKGE